MSRTTIKKVTAVFDEVSDSLAKHRPSIREVLLVLSYLYAEAEKELVRIVDEPPEVTQRKLAVRFAGLVESARKHQRP